MFPQTPFGNTFRCWNMGPELPEESHCYRKKTKTNDGYGQIRWLRCPRTIGEKWFSPMSAGFRNSMTLTELTYIVRKTRLTKPRGYKPPWNTTVSAWWFGGLYGKIFSTWFNNNNNHQYSMKIGMVGDQSWDSAPIAWIAKNILIHWKRRYSPSSVIEEIK